MLILVVSNPAVDEGARAFAAARIRFALRRLRAAVPRVEVRFADVNGPRGGMDQRCRIQLRTDGAGTVVKTAFAHDWRAALDCALAAVMQSLTRARQRRQRQNRIGALGLVAGDAHA